MRREDWQEWAEAYDKEYQGFIEQGTLKIARPEVLDTTTRADNKVTNGVFDKRRSLGSDYVSAATRHIGDDSPSGLVARTRPSRTCPVADKEHVRNSAGSPSMASENFWMDGIT